MKTLISLSKPELVDVEWPGENGLYSRMLVTAEPVLEIAEKLGLETDPSKLHVTVMYSKDHAPDHLPEITTEYVIALITGVKTWVGHDGKTYCVAQLCSPELVMEHARLTKAGCRHSFVPYEPHVTLTSDQEVDADKLERVNLELALRPIQVELHSQFIGDVKSN